LLLHEAVEPPLQPQPGAHAAGDTGGLCGCDVATPHRFSNLAEHLRRLLRRLHRVRPDA
jgi:hypothetical protein